MFILSSTSLTMNYKALITSSTIWATEWLDFFVYFISCVLFMCWLKQLKLLGEKRNCWETLGQLLIHIFRYSGSKTSHWPGLDYFSTLAAHPRSVKPQVSVQGLQVFLSSGACLLFLWLFQPFPPNFCHYNFFSFQCHTKNENFKRYFPLIKGAENTEEAVQLVCKARRMHPTWIQGLFGIENPHKNVHK